MSSTDPQPPMAAPNPDPNQQDPDMDGDTPRNPGYFPVVGIGASAGGLRALQEFFRHTPATSGIAWVVVTHLAPDQESHMAELLQSSTSMPVQQVRGTVELQPDRVYVIPPNRNLSSIDTHLQLDLLESERERRAPVDHFFRTLANSHRSQAIGVILSGTGSDGASGLARIKEQGGLPIVQDPEEAEYDSMPRNAIALGQVDSVLPVAEIGRFIAAFTQRAPALPIAPETETLPDTLRATLQQILALVRVHTGHDFARYKRGTLVRRIQHRMQLTGLEQVEMYLSRLRTDPGEVQMLANDLLISVTSFFRDQNAFEMLEQEVIPRLFENKAAGEPVRVWVAGCATGEEAFSLAILLLEYAQRHHEARPLQVFATDLSEAALQRAREGYYPETIAEDVSPERLSRFFVAEQSGYRLRKEVREIVLFAPHNLLKDPPFSRVDLISCRNVLIYLERDIHAQLLSIFHYALRPEGWLFLGAAEVVEGAHGFRTVNRKYSLYQRQEIPDEDRPLPQLPLTPSLPHAGAIAVPRPGSMSPRSYDPGHGRLLERFTLPGLIVAPDHNIVYYSAGISLYLQQPPGEPTHNALKRVRDELQPELATALFRAFTLREPTLSPPILIHDPGGPRHVLLGVWPVIERDQTMVLVLFHTRTAREDQQPVPEVPHSQTIVDLEKEREALRRQLQATVEEYETSKEEMQAANEELQSMNEELRATAEELETSKEELQSINEELMTVNQENKHRVEELSQLTSDLQNLLAATDIATLFLDRELRITRFTPRASVLFNVLPSDRGRPLAHLTNRLGYAELLEDAGQVLQSLIPIEREVQDESGQWYLTRLLPYRSVDDRIEGVVITFVDITTNKENVQALRAAKDYAESILRTVPDALLVLRSDLRIDRANETFYTLFEVQPEETEGRLVYELGNGQWDIPALRRLLEEILPQNQLFTGYEVDHTFEQIGRRTMLLNGRQLPHDQLILLSITDITQRKLAQEALQALNETLEARVLARTQEVQQLASQLLSAEQQAQQRMARVLHDELQQLIYSVKMYLKVVQDELNSAAGPEVVTALTHLDTITSDALRVIRQLTLDLSPPVLEHPDLAESLDWLAQRMYHLYGLVVTIEAHAEPTIVDRVMALLLYQSVRELLFNVVKHAEVNRARILVTQEAGELQVTVIDAGKGFDPAHEPERILDGEKGYGLAYVRDRVNWHGGQFEVESAPGEGCTVTLRFPLGATDS